ncbi:MAG: hypothetical protein WCI88_08505 [Chloroflexota bacterium]
MLPDPKKVANVIKGVFKSPQERQQESEIKRDVQIRTSKAHLRRHIAQQKDLERRLTGLAKRALSLNDEDRFRQAGSQILWTRKDIQRWEGYLLSLELLEARRDQAKASVDLLQAIKTMSESLNELSKPENMNEFQTELETGLARASNLEERMSIMMETLDSTLSGDTNTDEDALKHLETSLSEEIAGKEAAAFDPQIEEGLRKVRAELGKQ